MSLRTLHTLRTFISAKVVLLDLLEWINSKRGEFTTIYGTILVLSIIFTSTGQPVWGLETCFLYQTDRVNV